MPRLERYARLLTGHAWAVLIAVGVVTAALAAALRRPDVIAPNVVSLAAPSVRHAEEEGGTIRVDYLMRDVPETPEEIATLRARLDDDPALRGVLVTPDQRAALVMLDFYDGVS